MEKKNVIVSLDIKHLKPNKKERGQKFREMNREKMMMKTKRNFTLHTYSNHLKTQKLTKLNNNGIAETETEAFTKQLSKNHTETTK